MLRICCSARIDSALYRAVIYTIAFDDKPWDIILSLVLFRRSLLPAFCGQQLIAVVFTDVKSWHVYEAGSVRAYPWDYVKALKLRCIARCRTKCRTRSHLSRADERNGIQMHISDIEGICVKGHASRTWLINPELVTEFHRRAKLLVKYDDRRSVSFDDTTNAYSIIRYSQSITFIGCPKSLTIVTSG